MKSGFIALLGRPNVGKSTLLNAMIGKKVSIISPKPQTTRDAIQGIYTSKTAQMIFIDTPGIHKPNTQLGEAMNQEAYHAMRDVEAIVFVVDTSLPFGEGDQFVADRLSKNNPLFILLNKIDLCTIDQVQKIKEKYQTLFPDAILIESSALSGFNVDALLHQLEEILPEGPQYFPSDMISDHPDSFLVKEIVREKILYFLKEEVPHSIAIMIEKMETKADKIYIHATIVCEKEGQKAILIGRNGTMIKRIGMASRKEMERLLHHPCRLELFVRVEKDWRNSARYLQEFGYRKEK